MDLSSTKTDNITEILEKILEFTSRRDKILIRNIKQIHTKGFAPKDLDVTEFAELMSFAIAEHIRSERLLLCDTENIRFGAEGSFESPPIVDEYARCLLEKDTKKYLELQIKKLSENLINNKVATELLEHKQCRSSASRN